ncbi:MAG: heat-inducible transcription repressor HrcA [Clostridia bacterium]|jgi:heat-inducible transcriptional repressor|nr:heat-inducible transcription repressor HrcA [Clostridia bacterium]MBT7122124.1 heat-inducible transcription repressor HrcA [Clostridia bacterium]
MDLSERKLSILKAVIDDYIMTGFPVGSRTISKKHGFELSSATIRNEMADLEELGFLDQPHTSAGRIPSHKAYRYYVDRMMKVARLNAAEAGKIRSYFEDRMSEIEQVMEKAAQVLSETTHQISMVLRPQLKQSLIKSIQMVKITERKAILLVVTNAGLVKDSVIVVPEGISSDYMEMISRLLTDKLSGKTLEDAEKDLITGLNENVRENSDLVDDIVEAIETSVEPHGRKGIVLGGTQNIIDFPAYMSVEKAKNFISVLESKDMLYDMMKKASQLEFSVTIGHENEAEELSDMSVVTATYKIGGKSLGSFGVIGPTRMDYSKIVSILGYVSNSLNSILSDFTEIGD